MLIDSINGLTNEKEIQTVLNNSTQKSDKFGPDEAVLELIEDEISLIDEGNVSINYEKIKIAAMEIGVSEDILNNTIAFLITLSPRIIHVINSNKNNLDINVLNFREFREKYPKVVMADADSDAKLKHNGIAKTIGA